MKKLTILILICSLTIQCTFAQNAKLTVNIINSKAKKYTLTDWKLVLRYDYLNMGDQLVSLKPGNNTQILNLKSPQFFIFSCNEKEKDLSYDLYIRPGDNIELSADFSKPDLGLKVTGKGSENNQPLIGLNKIHTDLQKLYGDSLPGRVLTLLKKEESEKNELFTTYLSRYKPSQDFIRDWKINLKYLIPHEYFSFKENNKYRIAKSYQQTEREWKRIQDSLFKAEYLSNDKAFVSDNYKQLLGDFLSREKERLWKLSYSDSTAFFKDWYGTTPDKGRPEFKKDMTNLLSEKIINRYFKNKSAEYLYAVLIESALEEKNNENIPEIYLSFKRKFPNSIYLGPIKPHIEEILRKQQNTINNKMTFADNNGRELNTFEEVLALTKGKTLLLDMWGTWCGPCRQEIENNTAAIKKHFKDKGLDYLYIANHDLQNEKKWKSLIPYFNMEGLHILANQNLSKDIMDKVKGDGYPTYVIIKSDGSFELSKAGYPMKREVLIKQLEEALETK
ncbi:TlpA family protein disulfide reductase [Pedobacter rhizosphaerae]|uniref:Thiol-disulfide isomerase or thioredoxin n=1 Tax=Pedobacter rhizosphaerae TaxID=390241 RepID=A0A1H9R281_9SPHI|nr:TlpA disulfide reductase family protein [Pedobacter rhizosphaerae]SER66846.1 Thiol-disulfide isomerase or thioredoxin [Pedobacter rhizosphaerae]